MSVIRRATELAVRNQDCPWCRATAGELCYSDVHGRLIRDLMFTHLGRFAGLGDPADYVARHDTEGEGQ